MQALSELYKVGPGPSSSHTIGPQRAAKYMLKNYPTADYFKVTLYGSLSLTGEGHLTDHIILETLKPIETEIVWTNVFLEEHPNAMSIEAFRNEQQLGEQTFFSVGGGTIVLKDEHVPQKPEVYKEANFEEIQAVLHKKNWTLVDYVKANEEGIEEYLSEIYDQMMETIAVGLKTEGILPSKLQLKRVAKELNERAMEIEDPALRDKLLISSYAYAVNEQNSSGNLIVTSPTCGACGVVPAVLKHYTNLGFTKQKLVEFLMVGGVIGNLVKQNATISGAEGGCQAEVGTACAMAAAGTAYLLGGDLKMIEYAAEVAIEHHLGLTCDPVIGVVQIPCIERNAVAALRAIDAAQLSIALIPIKPAAVSLDIVIQTMKETGQDLQIEYKETSLGGLAKYID